MSTTYLLAHVSLPDPSSSSAGGSSSTPSTPNLARAPSLSPTASSQALPQVGHSDAIWQTRWSTTETGEGVVVTAGADGTVKTWNPLKGGYPSRTMKGEGLGVVGLEVDKAETGATFIVSNTLDSVITRWSLDGTQQAMKELGPAESWHLALHPRTNALATVGNDAAVRIMSSEVESFGSELARMDATGSFGTAVEYSPDGRFLAVASNDGYLSIFDAQVGQLVSTFPAHSAPIRSIAFTGGMLITGSDDKRSSVFDLRALAGGATGQARAAGGRKSQVASLGGHTGWVTCVKARNDRLLASASSDGTIKLFDLANPGSAISTLRDHVGDVWSLAWAPTDRTESVQVEGLAGANAGLGGGRLLSAGEDCTLRWWRSGG